MQNIQIIDAICAFLNWNYNDKIESISVHPHYPRMFVVRSNTGLYDVNMENRRVSEAEEIEDEPF